MTDIRTRTKPVGREPKLRDKILKLLIDRANNGMGPMTAKDIALHLQVDKSTPFRPLKELHDQGFLIKSDGIDGMQYIPDDKYLFKTG